MPHGDFSDYAALFCATTGLTSIFAPKFWYRFFSMVSADHRHTP